MGQFGDEDLSSILFGSIPKHEDLCYLMGTINLSENNTASISNKAYQCQIFKCRCLIFTVSEVIASPVLGAVQNIHILISKKYYQSGKLAPHLEKMNIKVAEPQPLTNAVYEACLRYTILARLAPSWNQVEKYLVHGRDFLLSPSPLDAVKLDIVINDVDMHIVLWPLRLRLPQVCAQDLQTSLSSPFSWDLSSNNMTVHVLPSLNKANVLMVSGHIPQNALFKSYKDLKRHWKNSYGYRLPDSDEGMVYVTVKFGRWFSESLTYPIVCARARRPVFLRQLDPQRVLLASMFSGNHIAISKLDVGNEVVKKAMNVPSSGDPSDQFCQVMGPWPVLSICRILADLHAKVPTICGHPFGIEATVRYAMPKLNVLSQVLFPCNLSDTKPELKKLKDEEEKEDTHNTRLPATQYSQPVSQYSQSQCSRVSTHAQAENKGRSHSPPPFLPRLSKLIPAAPPKPVFVPVFTPKLRAPPSATTSTSLSPPLRGVGPSEEGRHPPTATVRPMFGGIPMKPVFGLAQSSPTFHSDKSFTNQLKRKSIGPFPLFGSPKPLFSSRGEKTLLHFPESACKKSRNKPQIQPGVDVKSLAHTRGGLDKVNTTTLIAYLRGEGVPCKVKDKKGDLVNKVLAHLKLPLQETSPLPPLSRPRAPSSPMPPSGYLTKSEDRICEDSAEM